MPNDYKIYTDKTKLNIGVIYDYLSNQSYWAKGRDIETIKKSIENSLCFGIYDANNNQVGFARVITDYTIFAWILDVFVLPKHQGLGLGKQLLASIVDQKVLQGIKRWGLATNDAHSLYEQFGFQQLEKPEIFMEKV